jgi:hypothetical protein
MQATLARCTMAVALGTGAALNACTADIHGGNTVNPTVPGNVTISTSADANHVKPGDSLPIHVQTAGLATVVVADAGSTGAADSAAAPAQTQVNFLFQIFIDSAGGSPLLVTAQTDFNVTIPSDVSAGPHKVICRVAQGNGSPTNLTASIDINVTSS